MTWHPILSTSRRSDTRIINQCCVHTVTIYSMCKQVLLNFRHSNHPKMNRDTACQPYCASRPTIFGSFGFSTKEPYTIMLCRCHWHRPALASVSVHTSPWHMVRHRNFILGTHTLICPPYMHIKYLMILTCSF